MMNIKTPNEHWNAIFSTKVDPELGWYEHDVSQILKFMDLIPMDDYKKIVLGVLEGKRIEEIDDITETIEKMTETVQYIDSWINMNGTQRTKPLKKARVISKLEFFIPLSEYKRLNNLQKPMEVFERPEEHMTIHRNDGSSIIISYEYGQVKVTDSRNPSSCMIREADHFISTIV
ncbi:hypothetical protein [Petrocella atlantisensis]|nr:hypothetical protein [Petrocella atlantisensis]